MDASNAQYRLVSMTDKTTSPSVTERSGLKTRSAMMSEYTIAQKSSVYGVVCFLVFIGIY